MPHLFSRMVELSSLHASSAGAQAHQRTFPTGLQSINIIDHFEVRYRRVPSSDAIP